MKRAKISRCVCLWVIVLSAATGWAQSASSTQAETSEGSALTVPRLVRFSGFAIGADERPMKGVVGITFSLYREREGGGSIWMETQNVELNSAGHYSVMLGASKPDGLPSELFSSNQARWLGVQISGQAEQPRVLLLSVPYALKAADAETIGGLPPSAFMLAAQAPNSTMPSSNLSAVDSVANTLVTPTGSGTPHVVPLWTSSTSLGNSVMSQNPTTKAISIAGPLVLPATSAATSAGGKNSQSLNLAASSFSSSLALPVSQTFRWQAEPVGNNTASPSGKLNLLFGPGASIPTETGLSVNSKGVIHFAAGQTLPTVSGNETVTGNLSANQLISTAAQGTPPLKVTSTTQVANLNASLLGGQPASAFALLGAPNIFTANQTVNGNLQARGLVGAGTTSQTAQLEAVVPSDGTLAFRLRSGANSVLDVTPVTSGGRLQTVLNTINNRDVIIQGGSTGNIGLAASSPVAKVTIGGSGEGTQALRLLSGPNVFLDVTPTNTGGKFQTVFDTVNGRDIGFAGGTHNVGIGTTAPNLGKLQIRQTGGISALTIDGGFPENNYHLDLVAFSPASGLVDYTFVTKREDEGLSSNVLTLTQPTKVGSPFCSGCVGIGTQNPTTTLQVVGGDISTTAAGNGLIAKSPDGTKCARIGIDNSGALAVTAISCP